MKIYKAQYTIVYISLNVILNTYLHIPLIGLSVHAAFYFKNEFSQLEKNLKLMLFGDRVCSAESNAVTFEHYGANLD